MRLLLVLLLTSSAFGWIRRVSVCVRVGSRSFKTSDSDACNTDSHSYSASSLLKAVAFPYGPF